jgi:hypothetical protein
VLRGVQHDLRNAAQLLAGLIGDPDVPDFANTAVGNTLATLDEQMARLDWCRRPVDRGPGPVDLVQSLESAIEALGLSASRQPLALDLRAQPGIPAVQARAGRLTDVLAYALLALRGRSALLAHRRTAIVDVRQAEGEVLVDLTCTMVADESDVERDYREEVLSAVRDSAAEAGAVVAEMHPDGSGLRLQFQAWRSRSRPDAH